MSDTVLLTGVTGFLGMEVLVRLLEQTDSDVIALVRAGDQEAAAERLNNVFARLYDQEPSSRTRVQAIAGDLSLTELGLRSRDRREIVARATSIIHCAASIAFDLPLERACRTNAGGTARVLALAHRLNDLGRLRRLTHISTAYVCGRHEGVFAEHQLNVGRAFRNTYERSKARGEQILFGQAQDLPLVVARPSIVVGDSVSGWTPSFNVIYGPLQALARGLLGEIPALPNGLLDIVPVNYVANAILALHEDASAAGAFHLVAGEQATINRRLLELACAAFQLPTPPFACNDEGETMPLADTYMPYFDVRTSFDDHRARRILEPLGIVCPSLEHYFSTIVAYAQATRWGKRSYTRQSAARLQPQTAAPRRRLTSRI